MLGSTWDWADRLDAIALRRMAQVTLALFIQPERWIHRRVERIYFKDHQQAHHQVSVDFTLPAGIRPVGTFEDKAVYIAPLFLLAKDSTKPLRQGKRRRRFIVFRDEAFDLTRAAIPTPACSNLDFTDQNGQNQPLVTHEQSGVLGTTMLLEIAEQVLGKPPTGRLKDHIEAIPQRSVLDLTGILQWLFGEELTPGDPRIGLRKNKTFSELAYTLANHSIVACLFMDGPPRRSIYKLSYDQPTSKRISSGSGAFWRGFNSLRRSLGWKSEQYFVPLSEIGASASYHVAIEIPNELLINAVSLIGKRYRWFTQLHDKEHRDYAIRQVGSASQGEIYIPEPISGRRVGLIWVKLRARRAGFLTGALVASIITTVMLTLAALGASEVLRDGKSEAGAAALLLLPTLLAAYIARPGEHAITSKMLRWARFALVADGILPALAVYFLITTHDETEATTTYTMGPFSVVVGTGTKMVAHAASGLEREWIILAVVSIVFVLLFIVSNITPVPHGETVYQPMPERVNR